MSERHEKPEREETGAIRETEVVGETRGRKYTAAYKRQMVEAASTMTPEERGALVRREGLYASHLTHWRAALGRTGTIQEQRRGPKANLERQQIKRLEGEKARLEAKLKQAELIIGAQKKLAEIFGTLLPTEEEIVGHKRDL